MTGCRRTLLASKEERVWVEASNYWPTKEALIRAVKVALDDANISIPFPQMDVHFEPASADAPTS